jgi:hypothetical protein
MTDTELERLLDGTLAELTADLDHMPAADIQQVREHPVVRYILYRISTPAERRVHFPASEEYYLAQAQIGDRRWKFQCQKASNRLALCASA